MNEETLQKQLRRATLLVFCIIAVVLVCGGAFSVYLYNAREKSVRAQVLMEAEEYKSRILKQLEADLQTLSTLSAFLHSDTTADRSILAERLDEANQNNAFLTIVYFDQEGKGVISTLGRGVLADAALSDISSEGRRAVESALNGDPAVSRLFESSVSGNRVFVYSVPVYEGDEVIGALAASDHIEIFSDIISGNTVLGGGGYIHLLDSEGDFLVRSAKTVVPTPLSSIFEGPYRAEESKDAVREALQQQERISSSFAYEGKSYPFLLEPVGVNDWYLFCVNTGEGLAANSSTATLVTQITFSAVLLGMIFLMLYGYRRLRNYSRSLLRLAYHDPLTGAENLSRFRQRLAEAMGETGGSVIAMSVRQFPFLNEIFGKEKANRLLCQIKETAELHVKPDEFFCRDTEDRFYLFFRELDQEIIRSRLSRFQAEMERTAEISQTNYQLAFYCGVTGAPAADNPEQAADSLMSHVQFALDSATGAHASSIWFFDTELHKKEELENYIESHMHQALEDGEFRLFLQPQKNLQTGMLSGAEALVRWTTGGGRTIFPDQFIPLFERNGFCVKLDLYMVEQVCRQIRSWIDRGIEPIPVSVNQSKLLFFEPDYVQSLTALVRKYDIPARLIILEILEGLALENVEELNDKICQLEAEGFRISLDDFGSGFSSMNTLGKLQIDELKLDRGFLLNASGEGQGRVRLIMEQIVQMARQLGISTVAEGVETPEDEQLIRAIGCDTGQGYLYSRPISAADFDRAYLSGPDARRIGPDSSSTVS